MSRGRPHPLIKEQRSPTAYKTALKEALRLRDGNICGICEKQLPGLNVTTFDHKIALGRGGGTTFDNLQLAHPKCNARKNVTEQVEIAAWRRGLLS